MRSVVHRMTGSWARSGWLATTLALAGALVISSWSNYRAARAAVLTLNMGQAEIHTAAIRGAEPRGGLERDVEALDSVLRSQAEGGLRYIALLESNGAISVSVGEPIAPVGLPAGLRPGAPLAGPHLVAEADRIRAFIPRPPDRGVPGMGERRGGFGGLPVERDSVRALRFGGPSFQYYLLEFEPGPANEVVSHAFRGLFLNGLGAALLTLVALGFWRVSRRYEEAQKQIERQHRLSQLGEMSAVLAHEIRNPLASLKGNAQLLTEGLEEGSREKRRANRVVAEAIRLEALTTDLLDFARAAPLERAWTDPVELLISSADEVAPGAVALDTSAAPRRWLLDARRLRQALVNLIRNAVQVSPEGMPPAAGVRQENGRLIFTIRDFGPGVPTDDRDRIFEPFFTTRTHGTGLGLPVSRRAVELHGGTLTVNDHPDGGAVFRIELPGGA